MVNISRIDRFFLYSARCIRCNGSIHTAWTSIKCLSVRLLSLVVAIAFFSATLFSLPGQTMADTLAISTENGAVVEEGVDIAAEKIDQFSQAYLQVLQLLSDRESEIPAADTNAEALKIEKSIESDAIAIIQSSGLTMPEYMQILGLASQDATFQDKVLGRMDESQEDS